MWRELTSRDWLGEDLRIELEPGGDLEVTDREEGRRTRWSSRPSPAAADRWWAGEAEQESSRVEFEIVERADGTAVRVTESRPLADLTVPAAMAMA